MDLTIPYTFSPTAMPGWIAWILLLTAMTGGIPTFFLHDV